MKLEMERTFDYPVVSRLEATGLVAEVRYAEYIEEHDNPRQNMTNLGVMACGHDRYNLGDEQLDRNFDFSITCDRCTGGYIAWEELTDEEMTALLNAGEGADEDGETTCPTCAGTQDRELHPSDYFKQTRGATVVLPLYLYDHSGISMSAGTFGARPSYPYDCQWDAGIVGFIFDTEESRAETGAPLDSIEEQLRNEVNYYDEYLRGEVYYWTVDTDDGEFLDSCHGYVGEEDLKYAEECALDSFKYHRQQRINEKRRETINRKWAAERDIVTVG